MEPFMRILRNLVASPENPLRFAALPDPPAQVALDNLLGMARETDLNEFRSRFVRLCESWPYMIRYVAAPQGGVVGS